MAVFKCKMCGGDIEAQTNESVGSCLYCGTKQTLPTAADEQKANLFNRANHFRRSNEFDKAIGAYENLIGLDPSNAEAHFGLALSRYGVEYVEDPNTGKSVPTLRRLQREPFLADQDYMAAIDFAPDGYSRSLYEEEGQRIAEIQRRVLQVSSQESPYDVFICYKDTTSGGTRTKDSTLAQDIYYQLEKAGHKVFFSRITLESKLGQEYEPYIFSALNSARAMIVVGTQAEYLNAVWVKNEWSRYLSLMKNDSSKLLIPCFRDMDPFDLPEELSLLQSLDMSQIGFMQDLLHGVEKVLAGGPTGPSPNGTGGTVSAAPGLESLYKRAILFLEDSDQSQAKDYFNKVLDIDPEYAPAYVGLLMVENGVRNEGDLSNLTAPISGSGHYQKALRFGDGSLRGRLEGYSRAVDERVARILKAKEERLEAIHTELSKTAPIKWQVLKTDESAKRMLVISKECISKGRFDAKSNRWINSEIWRYLNGEFLNWLQQTGIRGICETPEGKVFLLSEDEAVQYFPDAGSRVAKYEGEKTWWWLRSSPPDSGVYAAYVNDDGYVNGAFGKNVYNEIGGVRPAFWLNPES